MLASGVVSAAYHISLYNVVQVTLLLSRGNTANCDLINSGCSKLVLSMQVFTRLYAYVCTTHTKLRCIFTTLLALRSDVSSVKNDRKRLSLISATPKIVCTGNVFIYISVYSSG
jgi:hypothetical protein